MGRPMPLEPLSLKITTESHGARCVSVELQVWRRGSARLEKKGAPIPFGEESFSHIKVPKKLLAKPDVMKTTRDTLGQINCTLKEGPTGDYHLTCKLESTNE